LELAEWQIKDSLYILIATSKLSLPFLQFFSGALGVLYIEALHKFTFIITTYAVVAVQSSMR